MLQTCSPHLQQTAGGNLPIIFLKIVFTVIFSNKDNTVSPCPWPTVLANLLTAHRRSNKYKKNTIYCPRWTLQIFFVLLAQEKISISQWKLKLTQVNLFISTMNILLQFQLNANHKDLHVFVVTKVEKVFFTGTIMSYIKASGEDHNQRTLSRDASTWKTDE